MSKRPTPIPPLIPSLPTGGFEKENVVEKRLGTKKPSPSPSLHRKGPTEISNSMMLSSPSPGSTFSSHNRNNSNSVPRSLSQRRNTTPQSESLGFHTASNSTHRVLRYRETVDSLFCITPEMDNDHREHCQQIVDGRLANDPKAWIKALKAASSVRPGSGIDGSDLIRLHRRASTRFSNLDNEEAISSDRDTLEIWLRYAACQSRFSTVEDSRCTFRHIMKKGLGCKLAKLYLEFATFEASQREIERALDILRVGLDNDAKPRVNLEVMFRKLRQRSTESKRSDEMQRKSSWSATRKRETVNSESCTKRSKVDDPIRRDDTANSNMSLESTSDAEPLKEEAMEDDNSNKFPTFSLGQTRSALANQATIESMQNRSSFSQTPRRTETKVRKDRSSSSSSRKRLTEYRKPSALSNPVLLNLGKAQRVDRAEETMELDTDDELRSACEEPNKPAPKIKKEDLSYMLNWNPEKFRSEKKPEQTRPSTPEEETNKEAEHVLYSRFSPSVCKSTSVTNVVPITQNLPQSDVNGGTTNGTGRSHDSNKSDESVKAAVERDNLTARPVTATVSNTRNETKTETVPIKDAVLANANLEFLPLIHEKNMLQVNGVPYAKLGMIGKGGSCKVYRALSKQCSVVAVKKVKLEGLDAKGIEGYANEIALLKRLRGNPAIIQMHDSQVDLDRGLILIVMELGEVDLNVVLQDQAKQALMRKTSTNLPVFNANFVRLTWEQMLRAVHCIHEERIIHGDLKPANFLFVRGSLKLIDFGIAKAIQSEDTTHIYRESQIGTLNYMSPESICGGGSAGGSGEGGRQWKMGRPSDVWSLGCILYQMVYGRTPFAQLQAFQKIHAIVDPSHQIKYPNHADTTAIDCMKQILQRDPSARPLIVGDGGLLQHRFLTSFRSMS